MNSFIEIYDVASDEVKVFSEASENRIKKVNEPRPGFFIAETALVIERALDAGYEPVSFLLAKESMTKENISIIDRCPNVPVYTASKEILNAITGYELTRGFLGCMKRKYTTSKGAPSDSLFPKTADFIKDKRRIVLLDRVMNPTNLGAIVRSAAALSIDGIIMLKGCVDPLYRRALRVGMGNAFTVPWICISDRDENEDTIRVLRDNGYKLAGMALSDDSISVSDGVLKEQNKLAIVMGSERDGISDEVLSMCDYIVKIPMQEGVDSLNVAAASAVAFWELSQKIKERKND